MLYVTLFSLFVVTLASVIQTDKPYFDLEDADKHFEDFIKKFDRHYADEDEKTMRLEIFKQNLAKINERNMDPEELAEFDINNFADMTSDEMKRFTGFVSPNKKCKYTLMADSMTDDVYQCKIQKYVNANTDIPQELDWRKKNVVTSVKDQVCGSCWTYGTVGNIESMYAIKYNKLVDFSEQQLVDCDKNNFGCNGGWYSFSFGGLVTSGGVMTLQDYPIRSIAKQGPCQFDKSKIVAKVKDCILYDLTDEEKIRHLVATNGPVAIEIDTADMQFYTEGILTKCRAGQTNHAVLLVGYGTENGTDYWIIKNSWSEKWGDKGYFRVKRNINGCGFLNNCVATAVIG